MGTDMSIDWGTAEVSSNSLDGTLTLRVSLTGQPDGEWDTAFAHHAAAFNAADVSPQHSFDPRPWSVAIEGLTLIVYEVPAGGHTQIKRDLTQLVLRANQRAAKLREQHQREREAGEQSAKRLEAQAEEMTRRFRETD